MCEETDPERDRETYPYETTHDRMGVSFQTAEETELYVSKMGPRGVKIYRRGSNIKLKQLREDADKERRERRRKENATL